MAQEKSSPTRNPAESNPQYRTGGYHSWGVPGEEAKVRKHMRVEHRGGKGDYIRTSRPLKGGDKVEGTSQGRLEDSLPVAKENLPMEQVVYVIAIKDSDPLESPVFEAGENDQKEALAVFTDRDLAILYLQVARWEGNYSFAKLSPIDLEDWLAQARDEGIPFVMVNPNRNDQMSGQPQRVLILENQVDRTGQALYNEILRISQS